MEFSQSPRDGIQGIVEEYESDPSFLISICVGLFDLGQRTTKDAASWVELEPLMMAWPSEGMNPSFSLAEVLLLLLFLLLLLLWVLEDVNLLLFYGLVQTQTSSLSVDLSEECLPLNDRKWFSMRLSCLPLSLEFPPFLRGRCLLCLEVGCFHGCWAGCSPPHLGLSKDCSGRGFACGCGCVWVSFV